jgi:HK97 family phage major capsid protein
MGWKDELGKATALMAEIKALGTKADATAEEKVRLPQMMADFNAIKAKAVQMKEIETAAGELETLGQGGNDKLAKFKSLGDFLWTVWAYSHPTMHRQDARLKAFTEEASGSRKDMVENVGASGGFLVPPEFLAQLQAVQAENSIVRNRATIIPMRRRQVDIPVLDQTHSTAGLPTWFGGMRFYWTEETSYKTETDPEFRRISLVAHKLIGYTRASDELLDDSAISLEGFMSGPLGFAGGVAWMEDYAFLRGTGAGQPLGIINAGATIVVPRQADNLIGFVDICNMMENFLPSGKGVWVITQSAMSEILQMNGPAGNPSYIWIPNARDGVPGTLFGMPVFWTEKLPLIGQQGDILLADMKYYLVGDRQATTVETTKFDRWAYDETSFRAVHRVDGQPWLSQPLPLADNVSQVSPFVILGGKST